MRLNNPTKFLTDSNVDPHLIARGEVKIEISDDGIYWTDSLSHGDQINYLRISYDGGTTWQHTIDLTGKNDCTITFTIGSNAYKPVAQGGWADSGDDDYNKMINCSTSEGEVSRRNSN